MGGLMIFTKSILLLSLGFAATTLAFAAPRGSKSTITFGRSEGLTSSVGKKRGFQQDMEAVTKSHQQWKKAHLNKVLYSCQTNGEGTAVLAKKVADKMDTSKTAALKEAQQIAKTLAPSLRDATEPASIYLSIAQKEKLREKLAALESAKKKSQILERLAYQVKNYYLKDAPKTSPFGGGCPVSYSTALSRGAEASTQYYAETQSLLAKIEALTKRAKIALRDSDRLEIVAKR